MRVKYKDGGRMCSRCGKPKGSCQSCKSMAMGGRMAMKKGGGEAEDPDEYGEMKQGGKLKMVKGEDGEMVPFFAADGVGRMPCGGGLRFRSQPMDMPQYDPDPAQRRFNRDQARVEEGMVGALNRTARGMDRAGMEDYQAVDVLLNTLANPDLNREDLARAGRRRRTAKQALPLAAMAAAGLGGAGLAMQSKASLAGRSLPFGRAVLAALGLL